MNKPIIVSVSLNSVDGDENSVINAKEELLSELYVLDDIDISSDFSSKSVNENLRTFVMTIINTTVLPKVIGIISAWFSRDRARSIIIQVGDNKLEVSDITKEEQRKLIEWFQIQASMKF